MWSPVPWYYAYFQAAERANCQPWEFIEEYTPRSFWFEAAIVVINAEGDHAAYMRSQSDRRQTADAKAARKALGK